MEISAHEVTVVVAGVVILIVDTTVVVPVTGPVDVIETNVKAHGWSKPEQKGL